MAARDTQKSVGLHDEMIPAVGRIARVHKETYDTFTLAVEPAKGDSLAPFSPGQFSMLYVYGVGELPISISGDPQDRSKLVYTVRSVGKTTNALVSRQPGDALGVRGPYGARWPMRMARGKDVLIVAGGIGLAPLRPAIHYILRRRADYGRLIVLYGARSPRDLIYRKQLADWARLPDTQVLLSVDYGGLTWDGYVGVVTGLFRYVRLQPFHTVAMVCGPELMMRYVLRELESRGLPPGDIYISLERNMKCGIGLCGHCQHGPNFICKDGPIFSYHAIRPWFGKDEL
jgi:NAD(P)H-flavin reductase